AGLCVPDERPAVLMSAADHLPAVLAEARTADVRCCESALEDGDHLAGLGLPDPGGAVAACRDDPLPVGAELGVGNFGGVVLEAKKLFLLADVPDAYGPVLLVPGGAQPVPLWAEVGEADVVRMSPKGVDHRSLLQVPDFRSLPITHRQ